MKKILIIVVFTLFYSCNSDDSDNFLNNFSGFYEVISIKSDVGLDLNNDGIINNDFYAEMSGQHLTINNDLINYLNFDSIDRLLEIRPTSHQTNNNAKLIDFRFPHQDIQYLSNGKPFLSEYLNCFNAYTYEINNNHISVSTHDIDDQVGEVTSLEILDNGNLKMSAVKNVFDFKEHKWYNVNLVVEYIKIED